VRSRSERGVLGLTEDFCLYGFKRGIQGKRLMHQSDQRCAGSVCTGLGQCSEGQPVDDGRSIVWHG
jgi:hypothetical protein